MFLQEVAEKIYQDYGPDFSKLAIIFPNKRPAIYFRQQLGNLIDRPVWSPEMLTIHEFIQLSDRKLPADRLLQSFLLYEAYSDELRQRGEEPNGYERFFNLGEILLNDFAELESNAVKIADIYSNMANLAAVEQGLDYLSEEQQQFLERFWKNFSIDRLSQQKEKFLQLWEMIPQIFERFNKLLEERALTTVGNLYRNLLQETHSERRFPENFEQLIFVGFNALNQVELQLFKKWKEAGKARFFFDADDHYVLDPLQEAGLFMRRNLLLFGNELPSSNKINRSDRPLQVIAAEGKAVQVRLLPQLLEQIPTLTTAPEKVAILLADEQQLMPVLHALPASVPFINITMGYSLVQSPVFSLVQAVIQVQQSIKKHKGKNIYFQHLLPLLQHPWLYEIKAASELAALIHKKNLVGVPAIYWNQIEEKRINTALTPIGEPIEIIALIKNILELQMAHSSGGPIAALESNLMAAVYFQLNRLEGLLLQSLQQLSLEFIGETILQLLRSLTVPLEGEPLKGLQVMGLLESRGLDFDHLIVLNVNEGVLPKKAIAPTFIPDSIRRAFRLSVMENQDAIFAYVFYRLLQRSRTMVCLYNSSTDDRGPGEQSRFISQLEYETQIPVSRRSVAIKIMPKARPPITIQKEEKIMQILRRYLMFPLSPTAINTYLNCRLQFYFSKIAKIEEPEEIQEKLDARTIGKVLHQAMEDLYRNLAIKKSGATLVTAADFDFLKEEMDATIERAFAFTLTGDKEFQIRYSGEQLIVLDVIKSYVRFILNSDKQYAPFSIRNLELKLSADYPIVSNGKFWNLKVGGLIDRVDEKAGVYRILDYKTGKDENKFSGVDALFDRLDLKRNKAALQTFIYADALTRQLAPGAGLVTGLYVVRDMHQAAEGYKWQFTVGKGQLVTEQEMPQLLSETREQLQVVLEEIFDDRIPFDQTTVLEKCEYCPYKVLCGR